MENVLAAVALLSMLGFLLGMINPKWVLAGDKKPNRAKAFFLYGGAVLACGIALAVNTKSAYEKALEKYPGEVYRLNLSHQDLEKMPGELNMFYNLEMLDLSFNEFTQIPLEVFANPSIHSLDMGNNKIEQLPSYKFSLPNLAVLDLSGNPLRELPDYLGDFDELHTLIIYDTEIDYIPGRLRDKIDAGNLYLDWDRELRPRRYFETPEDEDAKSFSQQIQLFEDANSLELSLLAVVGEKKAANRLKFDKGSFYYDESLALDKATKIGSYLETQGYFSDSATAVIHLSFNEESGPACFELRMVVPDAETLELEQEIVFRMESIIISVMDLDNKPLKIILCDKAFKALRVLEPNQDE